MLGREQAGLLDVAEAAVEAAGAILRRAFRTSLPAELKADGSPVTAADRAAEQAMRDVLAERCPAHDVLGEEGGFCGSDARYRWVLDPIDGTRAFITGRPMFGTLIALLDGAVPILGIIDQPISGERWIGQAGARTRFRGRHGTVGARPCAALADGELTCTTPGMFTTAQAARWQSLAAGAGRVSYGGDCYAYGLLALGQIDIVAEAGLKLWDWAALLPIVQGAGGCMTDWAGRDLAADGDGTVLALGDAGLRDDAVRHLAGPVAPSAMLEGRVR